MEQNIKACQSINWWCSSGLSEYMNTCTNCHRLGGKTNCDSSKTMGDLGDDPTTCKPCSKQTHFWSWPWSKHASWWEDVGKVFSIASQECPWLMMMVLAFLKATKNSLRPHRDMVAILLQRGCQSCNCPVKVEPHCRTGTRYHCRASVQKIQRLHLILALGLDFIKLLTLRSPELWKGTMVRYPKTFRYIDPTLWFASLPSRRHMEFAEAWGFTQIWAKIPRKYCGRTQTKFL